MARGVLTYSGDRRGAKVCRAIADTADTASRFGGTRNVHYRDFEQQFVQRTKRAEYGAECGAEVKTGVSAIGAGFTIGESFRGAVRFRGFAAECSAGEYRFVFSANRKSADPGLPATLAGSESRKSYGRTTGLLDDSAGLQDPSHARAGGTSPPFARQWKRRQ